MSLYNIFYLIFYSVLAIAGIYIYSRALDLHVKRLENVKELLRFIFVEYEKCTKVSKNAKTAYVKSLNSLDYDVVMRLTLELKNDLVSYNKGLTNL